MSPEDWDEFRARLKVQLAEHRSELIGLLSADYERGPKINPFDPNLACGWIELWAADYHVDELTKDGRIKPSDRRADAQDLAKALRSIRRQLDRAFRTRPVGEYQFIPDLGGHIVAAWLQNIADPPCTAAPWSDPRYEGVFQRISRITDELSVIAAAADQVAATNRDKRGRPRSNFPKFLRGLAEVYHQTTGLAPENESGENGSFTAFVKIVLNAIDVERDHFTLLDDIRNALAAA
jgi:hypothetical protein